MRLQAALDRVPEDQAPPADLMKAVKEFFNANKQHVETWIALRQEVKRVGAGASDAALERGIMSDLKRFLTDREHGMTDAQILEIVQERFGAPVAVLANVVEAGASVAGATEPTPPIAQPEASPEVPASDPMPAPQEDDEW